MSVRCEPRCARACGGERPASSGRGDPGGEGPEESARVGIVNCTRPLIRGRRWGSQGATIRRALQSFWTQHARDDALRTTRVHKEYHASTPDRQTSWHRSVHQREGPHYHSSRARAADPRRARATEETRDLPRSTEGTRARVSPVTRPQLGSPALCPWGGSGRRPPRPDNGRSRKARAREDRGGDGGV